MSSLTRAQYRAAIREGVSDDALSEVFSRCRQILADKKASGELMTAGLFRYKAMLFLYLEPIYDGDLPLRPLADEWLSCLAPYLKPWPECGGDRSFAYMTPVFWFDEPRTPSDYVRALPPESRRGRIATLFDDKVMSYVTHHQAIAAEGLLVGDRYQFISVHENILFSYFETPRDRERVNIRREAGESAEISRWTAASPDSHFRRFPECPEDNFMVIDTVFSL